jgi:hypothetical protein
MVHPLISSPRDSPVLHVYLHTASLFRAHCPLDCGLKTVLIRTLNEV